MKRSVMTQQEILQHLGIEHLNAMQAGTLEAYPHHHDIVLLSPTGSGKTLAYLLPLSEELLHSASLSRTSVLVLVPSRELAIQTVAVVKAMRCGLQAMACYGGRPAMDEHRTMRELCPHILVCTPGRASDHLRKGNFRGEDITTLVIDEFDKSLELGFHDEMAEVMSLLPQLKRRLLLSATDDAHIPAFVGHRFQRLDYRDSGTRLHVHIVHSPEKDKLHTLRALLCHIGDESAMVFVNYRESVERVARYLREEGFSISAFHGGMEQAERERALYRFAGGATLTLICTDLAARGLDISDVCHIIHYHQPLNADAFTHRNGRTARWNREGNAWVILGLDEEKAFVPTNTAICSLESTTNALPPMPRWTSLYIGRGKKEKVNKVDIVGFLSKVGGLRRDQLGRVDVGDHWSYAAVDRKCAEQVLRRVKGQKIKGQKTIIEEAL